MTHKELHERLGEILYIEDYGMFDIILASIVSNSLKLGDPVWLTIIGTSSGGKSQIIRPFAGANPQFIHRIDDLTANTLISGSQGLEHSLLGRIGTFGIMSMDDLTVLFSKSAEERAAILSQFRMLYDGRFAKSSGNRKEEMVWEGYLGMIAGSTPSIYRVFGEVADLGERFITYRMRDYDMGKAMDFIINNNRTSKEMDAELSAVLGEYLKELVQVEDGSPLLELSEEVMVEIKKAAWACTLLRTPVHLDERSGLVDELPQPEAPLRVMKQLIPLAKALQVVYQRPLTPETMVPLLWVAYSLSNDKRRSYARALVGLWKEGKPLTSTNVSAATGLHTEIVKRGLDQLQVLDIVRLKSDDGRQKVWEWNHPLLKEIILRLDPPTEADTANAEVF